MKQKITLLAILFLLALFSLGQKPEVKNNEKFWKSKAERQIKGLKKDDIGHRQNHLIQNNKKFSQNSNLKSSQEIKQRLDSVISQIWVDSTSQLVDAFKGEFTYDPNGNAVLNIGYQWNEAKDKWLIDSKIEFAFNANNNMTQYIVYGRDGGTEQLVAEYKYDYTFDENEFNTQIHYYIWDETNNKWIVQWK